MLNSLFIRNYRNLKELRIDSIDRINLIAGKNNTGKSSLLEAIYIYFTNGQPESIWQIIKGRGEFGNTHTVSSFSSLFTNRFTNDPIIIGEVLSKKRVELKIVNYIDEVETQNSGEIIQRKKNISNDQLHNYKNYKTGFEIRIEDSSLFVDAQGLNIISNPIKFLQYFNASFVKAGAFAANEKLFDSIALTPKENFVVEALKIVEPKTERIAFVAEENSFARKAVIKLSDQSNVLPLQSMGDGMNRVLSIILALVNAENGLLLIDEFENGLHYSVQEQLWKIIFDLAKSLNIQVFATTHSNDCISSFEAVLNNPKNTVKGKLIRLDNITGVIKPVEYTPEELEIAIENDIETR